MVLRTVKPILVALAALVGVIVAVAQAVEYLTTGKPNLLLIAIAVVSCAVPITVLGVLWVRVGSESSFSWNTFRAVASISAALAVLALGTITVITIRGAVSAAPSQTDVVTQTPTADASPPASTPNALPPPTTCLPAGQPNAKAATVVSQVEPGYPLAAGPAYYKAKLAGKIQLELGGQLLGSIPSGTRLFLLGWGDPTTNDSTPKHNPGNGFYYRSSTFRITGSCYFQPQGEIAYPGAHGITFRHLLVLVDVEKIAAFTAPIYDEGYDDVALESLGVTRIAYFDVPTSDLE